MKLTLFISPQRVTLVLTFVAIILSLISLAGQFSKYILGRPTVFGLVRAFSVNGDSSIPTWYSSFALLLCSLLLAIIAQVKKSNHGRYVRHWQVLAAIFLYLSIDEVAMLHEHADIMLGSNLNRTGFLLYGWVAVGVPLVFVFVLAYLRFLAHLPVKTRLLFLSAGTVFIAGALGVEMISARHHDLYGTQNMTFALIVTLEEFLEMIGIVIFIYALLSYLNSYLNLKEVQFCFQRAILSQKSNATKVGSHR